jgi:hypothetical protein
LYQPADVADPSHKPELLTPLTPQEQQVIQRLVALKDRSEGSGWWAWWWRRWGLC